MAGPPVRRERGRVSQPLMPKVYVSDATSMRALMSDSEQKGRPQGSWIAWVPTDLSKFDDLNRLAGARKGRRMQRLREWLALGPISDV